MLVARISIVLLAVFAFAGLAEATSPLPRLIALTGEAVADEAQGPMDPVIEEPIRPLFPDDPSSQRLPAAECGAMSVGMLSVAMALMGMMRIAPRRALARLPSRARNPATGERPA